MIDNLNDKNVNDYFKIAKDFNLVNLLEKSISYCDANFINLDSEDKILSKLLKSFNFSNKNNTESVKYY